MNNDLERVLLVDDDPRNVRLLEGIFRADGYQVAKAHGGQEALQLVSEEMPDLILLDVMMPQMSGHEVCERLKADPRTRPIPVIMVTALNSLEDKVQGLDIGADDFVSKPVNRLELLAKARSLLRGKALHDELLRAKAELEEKNEELLQLERLKDSLTQMIVHDLKNPLTAIMGNLELALSHSSTDEAAGARRLSRALDSSRSMMRMILDLLDIGRLEENRLPLHLESLDIAQLLQECASEVDGLVKARGVKLVREPSGTLPSVAADRGLVSRIVANVLSNAIKHTPEGGQITLGASADGENVVISVRDTGEGIPAEFHSMIFEKFSRPELRKHGLATDRGLGLAFCKLAAEAHGGRILLESAPGEGSLFRISLPLRGRTDS
jgi:signal transduction histidine kinase